MSIAINPGTGPVTGTQDQARTNMDTFAQDVAEQHGYDLDGVAITYVKVEPETIRVEPYEMEALDGRTVMTELVECVIDPEGNGRFTFTLAFGEGLQFEIEMPGLPIEKVRWTGAADQDIWDYPRLYVDGSSWVWKYAVNVCRVYTDDD